LAGPEIDGRDLGRHVGAGVHVELRTVAYENRQLARLGAADWLTSAAVNRMDREPPIESAVHEMLPIRKNREPAEHAFRRDRPRVAAIDGLEKDAAALSCFRS
jgi:hypothetical protein